MIEVAVVGPGLAKSVFQAHGMAADGLNAFRRQSQRIPQTIATGFVGAGGPSDQLSGHAGGRARRSRSKK